MRITRRQLVAIGAGAAASATLGRWPLLAQTGPLITKQIPSSKEAVPVVGLGTRSYHGGPSPDERAPLRDTLKAFVEAGGKVIDTAPSYGNSETVLGELIAELGVRDKVFLATKVDRPGREAGIERMNASLASLRVHRVDLMQVHNLVDATTQLNTLREWKQAGRIRYAGVTTSSERQHPDLERLMRQESLDFIQLDYALDHREAAERLLPLAAERGGAVLVNLPFGRGRLFQAGGERPLPAWASEIDCKSWAQVFLKYVVSHPAVTCAIPGMTKPQHAQDNLGAARGRLPNEAMRRRMEQLLAEL